MSDTSQPTAALCCQITSVAQRYTLKGYCGLRMTCFNGRALVASIAFAPDTRTGEGSAPARNSGMC